MKSAKKKTWICLLLSLCIFFSGMCFEDIKTDSFFLYADTGRYTHTGHIETYLQKSKNRISQNDRCTEKLIGRQDIRSIITEHVRTAHKNYKRLFFRDYLVSIPVSGKISSTYLLKISTVLPEKNNTHSGTYTIRYIHCQDGKKADSNI